MVFTHISTHREHTTYCGYVCPQSVTVSQVFQLTDPSEFWSWKQLKKRSERRKHCALAVVRRSQKISPCCRPLPCGAGRPKFNHYLYLPTQFGEDRCTQFRVIVRGNRPTNTHPPTNRQDRLQYTAPQLSAQCNQYNEIKGFHGVQSMRLPSG